MSSQPNLSDFEIAIASNFTVEPIRNVLGFWADKLQLSHCLSFAPFQQILQCLVSVDSLFAKNRNGVNLVFLRLEDCLPEQEISEEGIGQLGAFIDDLERALAVVEQNHQVPLILTMCPRSTRCQKDSAYFGLLQSYEERLSKIIKKFSNVHYIAEKEVFDLYPMKDYEDDFAYEQGKIPYTKECFTALGTIASRKIAAVIRKPYKVIVLDCDNTLWRGICSEDYVDNLVMDDNYRALQDWMVVMQQQGFILCLCSKNLERDVWSVFDHFKNIMPLQKQHIVSWRINWQLKSENIKSLSEELNLGLDSFIFLDDNEVEYSEVKASLPQVASFLVPSKADDIPTFLKHLWVFDKLDVTGVDRERSIFYQQDRERKLASEKAFSFDEFVGQLKLHLDFYGLNEQSLERISQMTKRTNQFNLTGKVFSVSALRQDYMQRESRCLIVEAKDRYGDYGVIACAFYALDKRSLMLNNFLISCRALGKRIEFGIWDYICGIAIDNELYDIDVEFVKTERNEPAEIFIKALGMERVIKDGKYMYRYSVKNMVRV